MEFTPVHASPGDFVLFDSYLPHRSSTNESDTWRRAAYFTYSPAADGDLHTAYYAKKAAVRMAGEAGAISINHDFGGKIAQQ